jgi:hypothetical protein
MNEWDCHISFSALKACPDCKTNGRSNADDPFKTRPVSFLMKGLSRPDPETTHSNQLIQFSSQLF